MKFFGLLLAIGTVMMGACGRSSPIQYDQRFQFVKLDNSGNEMHVKSGPWACIRDNKHGLIWEVQTDDESLYHFGFTYSWYDSNNPNSRDRGRANGGSCHPSLRGYCDTEGYIKRVNKNARCGQNDWRLPTVEELKTLVDHEIPEPGPLVSPWLPNTRASGYWTSKEGPEGSNTAWSVDFASGRAAVYRKGSAFYLRLVSGKGTR